MLTPELQERLDSGNPVWISITGLRVKRFWYLPVFFRYAIPSHRQAERSSGCLFAEAKRIDGVFHTLTVWNSREDTRAFASSGVHKNAVRAFSRYFTGHILGYEGTEIPDWDEAHRRCLAEGRLY
ncbi:MAG: hypothetical protein KC800_02365 [Candidatus Eremiobacteraeota bacterium]|nr:hypothetical protein [Candidatus Eremiobacteraeota bacterium]